MANLFCQVVVACLFVFVACLAGLSGSLLSRGGRFGLILPKPPPTDLNKLVRFARTPTSNQPL